MFRYVELDGLGFGFAHSRKLTDLHDPHALHLLVGVLALHRGEGIGEPGTAELGDEGGLAEPLPSSDGQHIVKFTAGAVDPRHSRHEGLACDRSGVFVVLRAQVVDEQGVHTGHTVPSAPVEVVAHRVKAVLLCHHVHRVEDAILPGHTVEALKVVAQSCIVRVDPLACTLKRAPR